VPLLAKKNSIQFPGSRQYNSAGEPENTSELSEVVPNELVKVIGTREACQQAIEALSTASETPSRSRTPVGRNGGGASSSRAVSIPAKFFHALIDQGFLARQLRQSGIQLDLPSNAPAKPEARRPAVPASEPGSKTARIDEDQDEAGDGALNYAFEEYDAYEGFPEEDLEFNLRGREELLERGENSKPDSNPGGNSCLLTRTSSTQTVIKSMIEKVSAANKIGVLAGIPRSAFPRIIGSKSVEFCRGCQSPLAHAS
jgi:hypothetical protein